MAVATDAAPGVATTVNVYRSDGQLDFDITPFGTGTPAGPDRPRRRDRRRHPGRDRRQRRGDRGPAPHLERPAQNLIFDTAPFEDFTGGLVLAAGDINGDRIADIVIGPDVGGGPRIQVLEGGSCGKLMPDFFGLPYPEFRGGLRLAAGDVNRDGFGDLFVAPGRAAARG